MLDLWRHLEATRWDIACVTDHFMPNNKEREGTTLEGWSTLAALSALVPRLRVGTIVLGNTYRHPAVVAKMAAQVDIISGGRLLLGLGSGWQQNEHEAYGIPFYTMRERLERLDEACQVIRSLWTERRATFKGRFYQLSDAPLEPKPVQTPHPELMIGGGGERDHARIVAKHADHWNVWGGPGVATRKGKILDEHCAAVGRDPKTIRRSVNMALHITDKKDEVEALADTIAKRMGRARRRRRATPAWPAPRTRSATSSISSGRPGSTRVFVPTHVPAAGRAAPRPRPVHRRDRSRVPVADAPTARRTDPDQCSGGGAGCDRHHAAARASADRLQGDVRRAGGGRDKARAREPVSLANLGWVRQNFNANLDNLRLQDEQVAQDEILLFKQAGGRTVVDPTPTTIGRDPRALARIARATGLNVVMGAGYYVGRLASARTWTAAPSTTSRAR